MNYFWIKLITKGKRNSVFLYTLKFCKKFWEFTLLCFYRLFVEEELVGLPALEEKEIVEQR